MDDPVEYITIWKPYMDSTKEFILSTASEATPADVAVPHVPRTTEFYVWWALYTLAILYLMYRFVKWVVKDENSKP